MPFSTLRRRSAAWGGALLLAPALLGCRSDIAKPRVAEDDAGGDVARAPGAADARPGSAPADQGPLSPPGTDGPRPPGDGPSGAAPDARAPGPADGGPTLDAAPGRPDTTPARLDGAPDTRPPAPDTATPPPPDAPPPPPPDAAPPPPDAGGACTDECAAGARRCGPGRVETCMTGAAGCLAWAVTMDCAATSLVCNEPAGGAPVCQCAANAGPDVFVDPVAGNDMGALAPTGVDAPAGCRYKTLGKALASADATRNRVVAKSAGASAATPATFSGETFPLAVPAGVSLATADATPTPANYVLVFNGATAPAAVTLGGGASLSGFTVRAASGNPNASAVRCTTGSITVRGVALVGGAPAAATKPSTGIEIGTAPTDTCTGTVASVTIDAFARGVVVATAAAAPVQLSDSTLRDNGVGLQISAGPASAGKLTIERTSSGTAADGVFASAVSTSVAPALTATDLVVRNVSSQAIDVDAPAGMAAAQVTLIGGRLEGTASYGLRVRGGTVTATGTVITGAGTGATGPIDGVAVYGGSVALRQAQITGSRTRGLMMEGGTVAIEDGTRIQNNGMPTGASGIRYIGGTLTVGSSAGAAVDISGNAYNGIYVGTAGGSGAGTVSITRAEIHDNAAAGVRVEYVAGGATGTVSLAGGTIYGNQTGVLALRAPAVAGTPGVTIDGATIRENGRQGTDGVGVHLSGMMGDVSAAVRNATIRDNRSFGVLVEQGTGATTQVTATGNDVFGNNAGAGNEVGGILFRAGTLASFMGNKVHENRGIELGFDGPQNGGVTWSIGGSACAAGTTNQIYCYGPGQVGLRVQGTPASTVDARNVSWANAVPLPGADFTASGANMVVAAPACAAIACN